MLSVFLSFVIAQRIIELGIAKRHESIMLARGAVEFDKPGYRWVVIMHTAFFISVVLESLFLKRSLSPFWPALLSIFLLAQLLRYWAIASLGIYWNTKIIVAPEGALARRGPYKFMRHPNYAAVVTEIAVVPLIFSCYITTALFTLLNAFVLRRRIRIENDALGIAND